MKTHHHLGQPIEFELIAFPAFAWLCMGFEVRIDGRKFHPLLDGVGFKTRTDFDFAIEGRHVRGQIRSVAPMWLVPRLRYELEIEGLKVDEGTMVLKNWPLSVVSFSVFAGLSCLCFLGGVAVFFLIAKALGTSP